MADLSPRCLGRSKGQCLRELTRRLPLWVILINKSALQKKAIYIMVIWGVPFANGWFDLKLLFKKTFLLFGRLLT